MKGNGEMDKKELVALSIEHMQLILDDLEEERRDSVETILNYVAELEAQLQAAQGVVTVAKALIHFDENDSEDDESHRSWRKLWRNLRDAVGKVQP